MGALPLGCHRVTWCCAMYVALSSGSRGALLCLQALYSEQGGRRPLILKIRSGRFDHVVPRVRGWLQREINAGLREAPVGQGTPGAQ